jgi:single-strand DNA-binding protein
VEKWVKKGSSVYVEGKIRTRNYDDTAGIKRYVTEIHASRIEFFNFGNRSENTSTSVTTPNADFDTQQADTIPNTLPPIPNTTETPEGDLPF